LVVVLGAGFSRAVNSAMPLTNQLGEAVAERISSADQERLPPKDQDGKRFERATFEEWLSYLAEEQPQHTEDQSLEARALLLRVTRHIHDVLSEAQLAALLPDPPPWFVELLSVLHAERATVITFNYDNLVECGVCGDDPYHEDDILDRVPRRADFLELREVTRTLQAVKAGVPRRIVVPDYHVPRSKSLRLLKLHGSLSWYWVPGDPTGTTLQRWRLPRSFGHLYRQEDIDEERSAALPSSEPFIVPPAALKSEQLHNPVIREIWRRAAQVLRRAERVVLIGYSLQPADRAFGGMLQESLSNGGMTVEVVNPDAAGVVERLERLGVDGDTITERLAAEDCVQRWAEQERDRVAHSVVESLKAGQLNGEEKVLVGNKAVGAVAYSDEAVGDMVVQLAEAGTNMQNSVPAKELLPHLSTANRVVVGTEDDRIPVIDWEGTSRSSVVGVYGHLTLVPARIV
jgi:hypothetical protein